MFIPRTLRLVEDACLAARIRQIQSSPGGRRLSAYALLMLAFVAEDNVRDRPETLEQAFQRLVKTPGEGEHGDARSKPD